MSTRYETEFYSRDIPSIRESLKRIADALEKNNKKESIHPVDKLQGSNDIPGFEGTLKDLHNLKLHTDESYECCDDDTPCSCKDDDYIHNDYLTDLVKDMSKEQYVKFFLDMDFGFALSDTVSFNNHIYDLDYEEVLDCIKSARNILDEPTSENPDPAGYGNKDPYTYDNALNEYCHGIKNDSDHDIRSTAKMYEDELSEGHNHLINTKKDCILDYVTNEFGLYGARYTDIIKFAYYLGEHNTLKFDSRNRGYYSCAFNTRFGGHLIKGGKDCLVKGINKEGKERYFAFSFVEQATDYYKYVDNRNAR